MSSGKLILGVSGPCRGLVVACLVRSLCGGDLRFNLWVRTWSGCVGIRRGAGVDGTRGGRVGRVDGRGALRSLGYHGDRFVLPRVSSHKFFTQCSPCAQSCSARGRRADPARSRDGAGLLLGARPRLLIHQAVVRHRLRSFSSLHAQPSHDTHYMTISSAARSTSTQGLSPSVERRVEACQRLVLAAGHWSPGVSWAVGRRCTVTCSESRYLGTTWSGPGWDGERC